MRFSDFQKKATALEAAQSARYEDGQADRDKLRALHEQVRREWDLGPPQFLDSGARSDHGSIVVIYDGGKDVRIEVRDRSLMQHYGMELSQQYMRLSAVQWHMFAEVVDVVTHWRAGELDALPPGGAWIVRRK
jgi:hypothetical protein